MLVAVLLIPEKERAYLDDGGSENGSNEPEEGSDGELHFAIWVLFCTSGLTNVLLSLGVVAEMGGDEGSEVKKQRMLWVKRSR